MSLLTQSAESQLPLFRAEPEDPNAQRFLSLLAVHGHLTRKEIAERTGWTERQVRMLAEAAGAEVVRGQNGFQLTAVALAERRVDEVLAAKEAAISQGKKMIAYGIALGRRIHAKVA